MSSLVSLWVFSLWKAARFLWSRRFDLGMNRKESFDSFEKTEEDHSDLFTNTHSTLVFYYIHGTQFCVLIYGACYILVHIRNAKYSQFMYSQSILRGDHVRNSDSEAFDIHFYNLKLEKMSTIVKLPLIKIIYFIINIFYFQSINFPVKVFRQKCRHRQGSTDRQVQEPIGPNSTEIFKFWLVPGRKFRP